MSKDSAVNDDELEGLTDEERAAMELDDNGDEIAEGTTTDEGADGDEGEGDAGADDNAGAGEIEGAAPKPEAEPAAGRDDGADDTHKPIFTAQAPDNADEKLKEIGGKKGELAGQLDEGEITTKEYQLALDALNKEERDIERAQDRANLAHDMERQRAANAWQEEVNGFLDSHADTYRGEANQAAYAELDEAVRLIAARPSSKDLSDIKILNRAHKLVMLEREETGEPAPKQGEAKPVTTRVKPKIPPTLGRLPAAEPTDTSNGKYAALDRLGPDQLEDALMKLSDSERDAYLAGR